MSRIVLLTANARFSHASLSLRCLHANLGPLRELSEIVEVTISDRPVDVIERVLADDLEVVAMSVYLWNVELLTRIAELLRAVAPEVKIIIGGPEVTYEIEEQPLCSIADVVIRGEGEAIFPKVVQGLLDGESPAERIVEGGLSDLLSVKLPYGEYTDADVAHRVLYVEASRGCPFGCEFCLSSLDQKVRRFEEEEILGALERLWERGARQFKFIDRSIHLTRSGALFDFFEARAGDGLFVHFEIVPDRISKELLERFAGFPAGTVQLEAGLQTLDPKVAARIGRVQNSSLALENLERLQTETGVHLHTDLVVGLPGEDLETFGAGFDRLMGIRPHEIQVGILKRLRGAPISRHTDEWEMIYNPHPPYDILSNRLITFKDMRRMTRFARYFDLVYNSGHFASSGPLIWEGDAPFQGFLRFSDWLHNKTGQTSGIALKRLIELVFDFLVNEKGFIPSLAADHLHEDRARQGKRGFPQNVLDHVSREACPSKDDREPSALPPRQRRRVEK